jgi:predicted outer membrane lipoprotein
MIRPLAAIAFGLLGAAILERREAIKRKSIEHRRLLHLHATA